MDFQTIREETKYRRGMFGAPTMKTDIYIRVGGSDIYKGFGVHTFATRGSQSYVEESENSHFVTEIEKYNQKGERTKIISRAYSKEKEERNLLEQLSCCIELHFTAVNEFRQGRIPEFWPNSVDKYFSSLDKRNLVTNPEACK